jgi:hypothetical protein
MSEDTIEVLCVMGALLFAVVLGLIALFCINLT